jgi:protein-tyrosine phosphatase
MTKVLFVCLGNICRSAMAQGVLEHKSKEGGLNIIVDSAGTSNYHIGEAPDKRMQKKALEYHIDISNQRARQFTSSDFDAFDYIFAMDSSNLSNIIKLTRNEQDKEKTKLFLDYSYPNQHKNVPDPYYGGEEGFEEVYQLLDEACNIFIKTLTNE